MAQQVVFKGRVLDANNYNPLPFVDIVIQDTPYYTSTDKDGFFVIENINPGEYTVQVSCLGYENQVFTEMIFSSTRHIQLNVFLEEVHTQLDEVVINTSAFRTKVESAISVTNIGVTEINRSPGANRDISFVIRNLPGVATTNSFRNDLIVRGGSPSENTFYIDGIEVPNINHFSTEGASGGPVGMVNVNFIKNVNFHTGSFPVNKGNALSSVMDITTREADLEVLHGTFTVGSSDVGVSLDVPLKESAFLLSVRRSYLQLLFQKLKLPFLPTYNDFQYGHHISINNKNYLTVLGLGAIDQFKLNTKVNDRVTDLEILDRNNYILNNIPKNEQSSYVLGVNWKRLLNYGFQNLILSRNVFNNTSEKYRYNIEKLDNLLYDYNSQEVENKLRYEYYHNKGAWKYYVGAGLQYVEYDNKTFKKINVNQNIKEIDFKSSLSFLKYSFFTQFNRKLLNDKLILALSLRTDFNDFSNDMSNPFKQLSPRFSLVCRLKPNQDLVLSTARHVQLPAYTILGYRDKTGSLLNKQNKLLYIKANHLAVGYKWKPNNYWQIKIETFYKNYEDYPSSIFKGISLANMGSDYGVIGNTAVTSNSKGYSYGTELSIIKKMFKNWFGSLSYTYVRSFFDNADNKYINSTWDNHHIINLVAGYKFKYNWELGAKFRLLGGAPYTPYDIETSALKTIWNINQKGVEDYLKLNSLRLQTSHGVDLRLDKKCYFKHWGVNLYLDVQNVYNHKADKPPYFTVVYDDKGLPVTNDKHPNQYQYKLLKNSNGTVLPSIGLMIEF